MTASTITTAEAATTDTFRFRGARFRYDVQGSGPPLLLNNGIGASLELLQPLRDRIEGRTTIAWDAPGAGHSGLPAGCPSVATVVKVADALLDHLDYDSVDVLGVSWGGGVSQEMAIRQPERVNKLILAATSTGWTSRPGDFSILPIMLDNRRYTSAAYFERVAPRIYGGDLQAKPALLSEHALDRLEGPSSVGGYLWQLAAAAGWTSLRRLPRIKAPTLVMTGDRDPLIHISSGRTLARRIPNARLVVFEGAGHLFLITRVAAASAEINAFLNEPDRALG